MKQRRDAGESSKKKKKKNNNNNNSINNNLHHRFANSSASRHAHDDDGTRVPESPCKKGGVTDRLYFSSSSTEQTPASHSARQYPATRVSMHRYFDWRNGDNVWLNNDEKRKKEEGRNSSSDTTFWRNLKTCVERQLTELKSKILDLTTSLTGLQEQMEKKNKKKRDKKNLVQDVPNLDGMDERRREVAAQKEWEKKVMKEEDELGRDLTNEEKKSRSDAIRKKYGLLPIWGRTRQTQTPSRLEHLSQQTSTSPSSQVLIQPHEEPTTSYQKKIANKRKKNDCKEVLCLGWKNDKLREKIVKREKKKLKKNTNLEQSTERVEDSNNSSKQGKVHGGVNKRITRSMMKHNEYKNCLPSDSDSN